MRGLGSGREVDTGDGSVGTDSGGGAAGKASMGVAGRVLEEGYVLEMMGQRDGRRVA